MKNYRLAEIIHSEPTWQSSKVDRESAPVVATSSAEDLLEVENLLQCNLMLMRMDPTGAL